MVVEIGGRAKPIRRTPRRAASARRPESVARRAIFPTALRITIPDLINNYRVVVSACPRETSVHAFVAPRAALA
jgi:hypothetical protein